MHAKPIENVSQQFSIESFIRTHSVPCSLHVLRAFLRAPARHAVLGAQSFLHAYYLHKGMPKYYCCRLLHLRTHIATSCSQMLLKSLRVSLFRGPFLDAAYEKPISSEGRRSSPLLIPTALPCATLHHHQCCCTRPIT